MASEESGADTTTDTHAKGGDDGAAEPEEDETSTIAPVAPGDVTCPAASAVSSAVGDRMYLTETPTPGDDSFTDACIFVDAEDNPDAVTFGVFVSVYGGDTAKTRGGRDFWETDGWTVSEGGDAPSGAFLVEKLGNCRVIRGNLDVNTLTYTGSKADPCRIATSVLDAVMASSGIS